ncbi:hypothetical protein F4779DRAFT_634707 [Xylariaceae sp. FL0662B]|nr:hypothetical protein F4779DRAFT_634707 [Xylariaceae sp. FL0662B]
MSTPTWSSRGRGSATSGAGPETVTNQASDIVPGPNANVPLDPVATATPTHTTTPPGASVVSRIIYPSEYEGYTPDRLGFTMPPIEFIDWHDVMAAGYVSYGVQPDGVGVTYDEYGVRYVEYCVPHNEYGYSVPPNGYGVQHNGVAVQYNEYGVPYNEYGYSVPPNDYGVQHNGIAVQHNEYGVPYEYGVPHDECGVSHDESGVPPVSDAGAVGVAAPASPPAPVAAPAQVAGAVSGPPPAPAAEPVPVPGPVPSRGTIGLIQPGVPLDILRQTTPPANPKRSTWSCPHCVNPRPQRAEQWKRHLMGHARQCGFPGCENEWFDTCYDVAVHVDEVHGTIQGNMSSEMESPREFHRFRQLPPELRLIVWEFYAENLKHRIRHYFGAPELATNRRLSQPLDLGSTPNGL